MLDLYLMCADLKNSQSDMRKKSNKIILEIFNFLNRPSDESKKIIDAWKEDFKYIYGEIRSNLSSNGKLDLKKVLNNYGIASVGQGYDAERVQLLFYAIQTYFSLLIKVSMKEIMVSKKTESFENIILGRFAESCGIVNYCYEDWYCWPLFELKNGFDIVMSEIEVFVSAYRTETSVKDFVKNNNNDFIKQMYEAIIPKELRHALGEYYTPDWLAEKTLKDIFLNSEKTVKDISMIDPTCGSGTFLFKAIAEKRKVTGDIEKIISTVKGLDINPLAILTAKTNYLLAILDLLEPGKKVEIPVYNADIIKLAENDDENQEGGVNQDNPESRIKNRIKSDRIKAHTIEPSDAVMGNPPWVNWEYMPERYRISSQHLWLEYNLFSASGRDLSFSKEDISVLITYIVMDKLLKNGGIIGFVIRQGIFKSAQNGVGFRRFRLQDECGIEVLKVDDLSKIKVFDNAVNSTALFLAKKGGNTEYPVHYYLWKKKNDLKKCLFGPYSDLEKVVSQIEIKELEAIPAVESDMTSLWITADRDSLDSMKKILGKNDYRARTGVFTGGANAVYWLNINRKTDEGIEVSNITEKAKRKTKLVTQEIEDTYVYPMVKGSTVKKWKATYDSYLLCPHTSETKMRPVPQNELLAFSPLTYNYLFQFKKELDERKGFAGWEKEIQNTEFHAILRVGNYTFSKYKVIWKYIASEFISAVISDVDDPYLGKKMLIPNEKIMYISTEDEDEAYYLCGILSSTLITECIKSYMNPMSISAHILNKLEIPRFDKKNLKHMEIAEACKEGHGKSNILPYIERIDEVVRQIYEF